MSSIPLRPQPPPPMTKAQIREWIQTHADDEMLWVNIQRLYTNKTAQSPMPRNSLDLPNTFHDIFSTAFEHGAIYIAYNGIFVAPSTIGENQYGVFTYVDMDPNTLLTNYAGRIWPSTHELEIYFAWDPQLLLKKQRYLFDLSNSHVSDPTDIFGNLFAVQASGNVAPYFNEPPLGMHANCFVEAEHDADKKNKYRPGTTLHIITCSSVFAFRELFIIYESEQEVHNGQGKYELRDYLVGSPCKSHVKNAIATNPLIHFEYLLHKVKHTYAENVAQELKRIETVQYSSEYQTSAWLRPEILWEGKSSNRKVCQWPDLDVSELSDGKIELRARRLIPKSARLPVFGIPMTEEGFITKSSFFPDAGPFLIQGRVGYLYADPHYRTFNYCGGDGSFIWVWISPVTRRPLANMELHTDGDYFHAIRNIAEGELLTYYSM